MNAEKIFPVQQHSVELIVEHAAKIPEVEKVIIFGSSVRQTCNPWSDIDAYVIGCTQKEWGRVNLPRGKKQDIWFEDEIPETEPILKNIRREGVCVYEKDGI